MIEFALRSQNIMTYDEAVLYCLFLDLNGHKDWRIPTVTELSYAGIDNYYLYWTDQTNPLLWGGRGPSRYYVKPVRSI